MKQDKPAVCYQTGLDESFLVGTRSELIAFAQSILDAVDSEVPAQDHWGVEARSVVQSLTEVMAHVVIDGILIVDSTSDRYKLMNRILENNGESPIDWESRQKLLEERQQTNGEPT